MRQKHLPSEIQSKANGVVMGDLLPNGRKMIFLTLILFSFLQANRNNLKMTRIWQRTVTGAMEHSLNAKSIAPCCR